MAASVDLWGELTAPETKSPVAILREQAALLGKKTNNLVEAAVETQRGGGRLIHRLNLIVPALDDYRYELLRVAHDVGMYPLDAHASVMGPGLESDVDGITNEDAFRNWLAKVLQFTETKRIIANLSAQVAST